MIPTDARLLGNPLDFFHEDHLRERQICAMLDRIADAGDAGRDDLPLVLQFLREELPLHLADEEEDLFPLLKRRCAPEDNIGTVIARLTADHRHADGDTPDVIGDLEDLERTKGPATAAMRERLVGFAAHARRHLILENAIVLPFARLRLTADDLDTLRLRMLQRRGLDRVMESEPC